ncbi:MAG: LptF/LptG family permease [Nitrospiraceae bacterium]|nr:MAG: LptF/LptG family permease [Nitrospiraceae bacterium]
MKIFRRYFLKEFSRFFIIVLVSFTAISIVAEFFDKAAEFYAEKPPVSMVIKYLLLQTPRVILYALPFASLFSILITIGMASKWRETVIIKASGASMKKLFSSFLILGIFISFLSLLLGETVVPEATRTAAYIRKVHILKQSPRIIQSKGALWMKGLDGSLVRIDGFVENENRTLTTSIFKFNPSFGLEKRTEADEAVWDNGVWTLKNVSVFDFKNNTASRFETLVTTSLEEPKIFREEMKKPEEMNFRELYNYYSRLEKAGFRNLRYIIQLYEKLAYPSINFVMILFGISLALNTRWGGGMRAAGLGVIISVFYWLLYSVSISMGNTGILQPWLAPWISPLVFGIAGGVMYWQIKE